MRERDVRRPGSGFGIGQRPRASTTPATSRRRRRSRSSTTRRRRASRPRRPAPRTPTAGTTTPSPSPSRAPTPSRASTPARPAPTAGPDSASAAVTGTCRDKAGNAATASFALHYDATPPDGHRRDAGPPARPRTAGTTTGSSSRSAAPTRPPASPPATPPRTTSPTEPSAHGERPLPRQGRQREPPAPTASGSTRRRRSSQSSTSTRRATRSRSRGRPPPTSPPSRSSRTRKGNSKPVTLYDGKRITSFTDKRVAERQTATRTSSRPSTSAGNAIVGKGDRRLRRRRCSRRRQLGDGPRRHDAPLALGRHATYYNVQLWRAGKKVLTTWPAGPSLRAAGSSRPAPTWLVWPGLGPRSAAPVRRADRAEHVRRQGLNAAPCVAK